MNSRLDFGMYKGYDLGIVYVFDPSYVEWCINNVDNFYISNLSVLKEFGVINDSLDWQYRAIGDPSLVPNIDVFDTFEELLENVDLGNKKYTFREESIARNEEKVDLFDDDDENNDFGVNDHDDENEYFNSHEDRVDDDYDSDTCPACGGTEYMCCNYWIERNS